MTITASSTQTQTEIPAEVQTAVAAFAAALAETPEFQAFEEAAVAFKGDQTARQAVRLFQEKQKSLQLMLQLGAVTPEELDELKQLRQAMMDQPSVRAYVESQEGLIRVCQTGAQEISQVIGIDFASACARGCC